MTQPAQATRNWLLGVLAIVLLLVGIVAVLRVRSALQAPSPTPTLLPDIPGVTPIDPPLALPDFTLPSSLGQPLSLSALHGKFALLFFGYTHCPDYCPLTLAHWKNIKTLLGDAATQVNFLFISVDGERDTPDVLNRYLARFEPSFIGISGDEPTLTRIGPDYGLYYQLNKDEGENYSVDHTAQSYLLDAQERMIDVFSFDTTDANIVETIQKQLAHQSA